MSNMALPLIRLLIAMTVFGATGSTMAQTLPRAFVVSPDIYKVVAEDDKYLVIEANWKPGQQSKFSSSPASLSYNVTDCHLRRHFPDRQVTDYGPTLAGSARQMPAYDSVSFENVGKNACRVVTFAPK